MGFDFMLSVHQKSSSMENVERSAMNDPRKFASSMSRVWPTGDFSETVTAKTEVPGATRSVEHSGEPLRVVSVSRNSFSGSSAANLGRDTPPIPERLSPKALSRSRSERHVHRVESESERRESGSDEKSIPCQAGSALDPPVSSASGPAGGLVSIPPLHTAPITQSLAAGMPRMGGAQSEHGLP